MSGSEAYRQAIDQPSTVETRYGADYYQSHCGRIPYERNSHWLNFFGGIADEIIRSLRPKRVFDAGCAWGFLVEAFRDRGVDAQGVDLSTYAIGNVRPDMQAHCSVASLTEPIAGGPFDLVTCIEVLEHMPECEAREAMRRMTLVTDSVLFSSTPDDFDEPTHVNVHPVIYWLRQFAELQFYPDLLFDASFIASHAFLVRRRREAVAEDVLLLFSETIRNRVYRAAFLARQTRVEQLEKETDGLHHRLEEASRNQAELLERSNAMRGFIDALSEERERWRQGEAEWIATREELYAARRRISVAEEDLRQAQESNRSLAQEVSRLRDDEARWKAQAEASEFTHLQSARLAAELQPRLEGWKTRAEASESACQQAAHHAAELQRQLEESKLQTAQAESVIDEWMAHSAELSHSIESLFRKQEVLQAEWESLHASPGWQLILRYRDWLRVNRSRSSWTTKLWDAAALWTLRRLKLGGSSAGIAIESSAGNSAGNFAPAELPVAAPAPVNNGAAPALPGTTPALAAASVASFSGVQAQNVYETWIQENEPDREQLEIQRQMSPRFSYRPKISVLVPVHKVPLPVFREAIESVVAQTYDNWELCIAGSGAENPEAFVYLQDAVARDARIRVKPLTANEGISGNSNQALSLAAGEYLALLDHDDTLAPFALFEVVQLLNQDRTVDFIYSDKDQITEDGKQRLQPLFKPEWSPELMLNANYLTHLCVMRTDHVREIGGWRKETDGAQDWDLFLRFLGRYGNIRHIPKVLYHWRQIGTSVASGGLRAKPYAAQAQVACVAAHCDTIGLKGAAVRHEDDGLRIEWPVQLTDKVSIVYLSATPGGEALARAAKLAEQTTHPNFEVLVPLPTEASQAGPIRCVTTPATANLLDRIDLAVRSGSGQTIVLIGDCVTPIEPDWLNEITGPLQLPAVGIVGARLLDANSRALRHCGLVFTSDGRLEYIYAGQPQNACAQAGGAAWYRNWTAVSGACLAIRRDVWDAVGGMSGEPLHPRLDVHLNLKVRLQTDWRILYNPYARLLQSCDSVFESSRPGADHCSEARCVEGGRDLDFIRACFPDGDPYFSANLDCSAGKVSYRFSRGDGSKSRRTDYAEESQALVQFYDCAPAQVQRSRSIHSLPASGRLESITWFLPDFVNPYYGGIHTLLRFADAFWRDHNVRSQFCVLARAPESRVRRQVAAAFPELAAASRFFALDDYARVNELPASDAAVCSLWATAYAALGFDKTRRKFYFIQDDEPLFYPAGSTSALADATYGFGFYGICNTISLLHRYTERGGQGEYFDPCIDNTVFHDRDRKPADPSLPYTVFCYARPNHPRNSFELLAAALRILKKRMGDRLLLIAAGADWRPNQYGLDGFVQNLGLLNYQATGALYRMCDAGVVIMMTRHPSYLPMEMMGCGSLVITNRNPATAWLLQDGENCLLADLSPSALAERIEEGLSDVALRRRVTENARDLVRTSYSRWENQIDKIHRYMLNLC